MPRGSSHGPSVKRPKQYEAMRERGASKGKAARISNTGKPASRRGGRSSSYDDMTKSELLDRARNRNISGRSSMSKGDLIKALRK
jgi:hypothetical protein